MRQKYYVETSKHPEYTQLVTRCNRRTGLFGRSVNLDDWRIKEMSERQVEKMRGDKKIYYMQSELIIKGKKSCRKDFKYKKE